MPFPLQDPQWMEALRKRFNIQGHAGGQLIDDVFAHIDLFELPKDMLVQVGVRMIMLNDSPSPAIAAQLSYIDLAVADGWILTIEQVYAYVAGPHSYNFRTTGVTNPQEGTGIRENRVVSTDDVGMSVGASATPQSGGGGGSSVFLAAGPNDLEFVLKGPGTLRWWGSAVNTALSLAFKAQLRQIEPHERL